MMKTIAVFLCAMLLSSGMVHASGIKASENAEVGLIGESAAFTKEETFPPNDSTLKENEDASDAGSETDDGWKGFDFSALPLISGSGGDTQAQGETGLADNEEQPSFFILITVIFIVADGLAYLVIKWFGKNKGNPK